MVIARILYADVFGNLITTLRREDLPPDIDSAYFFVESGKHKFDGIVKTYLEAPPGTPVALFGASGLLELAVVQGNAASELQIPVGDSVTVRW
jgi:S-adenosylmethionine hydrolase